MKSATLDSWFAPMDPMPNDTPKPDGGSNPQLDNVAREAERVLDELTASIPETLASRAASFRESAREIDQRRARASESGATPVSGELEWAKEKGRLIAYEDFELLGDPVSNDTSEHEVWRLGSAGRAIKRSWPGVFGQYPILWNGRIRMKNASLPEYLRRMALHVALFGSDIRFEGITVSNKPGMMIGQPAGQPSAVISQEWISAASLRFPSPDEEEIAAFMRGLGFRKIRDSFTGWARHDGVVVMDAKSDNFILTDKGIIPIDLQIGVIKPSEFPGLDFA